MNALALLGAVAIGLSLGLTGAGGSILTLPILVYLAKIPPKDAVGLSLLIVGISAFVGAWQRARSGELHYKAAGLFVLSGAVGAALGSHFTHLISPEALLLTFATLMIFIGVKMLIPTKSTYQALPNCHAASCLTAGFFVGILTGFLGVGGGFLLMPALMKFAKLPLKIASGTSLAIIACNSAAGFLSHLHNTAIPLRIAMEFSLIAAIGVWAGGIISSRLPEKLLKRAFAILILCTAAFLLSQ